MAYKSYTSRDIVKIREDIIEQITQLTDRWTDFNESDVGIALIEVLAGVADMLNFYLDQQALEVFPTTARQEKNIRSMLSLINFKLPLKSAPISTQRFILTEPWGTDVTIPRHTHVVSKGDDPIHCVTVAEGYIRRGQLQVDVPVVQGIAHQIRVSTKDLKKSFRFKLPNLDIAEGLTEVVINGTPWEEVEDAFLQFKGGRHFSVHEDNYGNPYLMFTWDYKEYLSTDDSELNTITVIETKGKQNIISEGVIDTIISSINDQEGYEIRDKIMTYNIERFMGGSNGIPLEKAKVIARNSVKSMGKLVVLDDFKWEALKYPGVIKAQALDWSVSGAHVNKPYLVELYIVTEEGGPLTNEFKRNFLKKIKEKAIVSAEVSVLSPKYIPFDIHAKIYHNGTELQKERLEVKLNEGLREAFKPENLDFDKNIDPIDVRNEIRRIMESNHEIELVGFEIIKPEKHEFPYLRDIKIEVVRYGE